MDRSIDIMVERRNLKYRLYRRNEIVFEGLEHYSENYYQLNHNNERINHQAHSYLDR